MNNDTAENVIEIEDLVPDDLDELSAPEIAQPETEKAQHPA